MKLTTTLLAGALAVTGLVHADNITVKGSDTMVVLGQKWAETYMKKKPGTTVQVTGGGSGTGECGPKPNEKDARKAGSATPQRSPIRRRDSPA